MACDKKRERFVPRLFVRHAAAIAFMVDGQQQHRQHVTTVQAGSPTLTDEPSDGFVEISDGRALRRFPGRGSQSGRTNRALISLKNTSDMRATALPISAVSVGTSTSKSVLARIAIVKSVIARSQSTSRLPVALAVDCHRSTNRSVLSTITCAYRSNRFGWKAALDQSALSLPQVSVA